MARALVDTVAIVALVNRDDRHHTAAQRGLQVIAACSLHVSRDDRNLLRSGREALISARRCCGASAREARLLQVEPVTSYAAVDAIMSRYVRLPCDYADATLIALAEDTGVTVIATINQPDFSVYRTSGRKRFRIVLG